jgi:hypothetical protein
VASTSKLLKEEIVSDILNEPDECVISDSNNGEDSKNCVNDTAVADAEEDSPGGGSRPRSIIHLATVTITVVYSEHGKLSWAT